MRVIVKVAVTSDVVRSPDSGNLLNLTNVNGAVTSDVVTSPDSSNLLNLTNVTISVEAYNTTLQSEGRCVRSCIL